jgi:hypothetical protein
MKFCIEDLRKKSIKSQFRENRLSDSRVYICAVRLF